MANKNDLKFYLTGLQPAVTQIAPSQSLGGYPSTTEYSVNALLADGMDSTTDTMLLTSSIGQPAAVLADAELMSLGNAELFGEYGDEVLTVQRGQFGTEPSFHIGGDTAYAMQKNGLFNGSLANGKQYRCIAVRNDSETETFYHVKVYVKSASKNPKSVVRLAVEVPLDTVFYSTTLQGTTISLTDDTLKGAYPDNTFVGRLLTIDDPRSLNYNSSRLVASFDSKTGTFTFFNSLAFPIEKNVTYRLDQSPSQRVTSGRVQPAFGTPKASALSTASGSANAVSLNFSGTRTNSDNLLPNQVMYVWFERDISANTDKYVNNSLVFTINYRNS